jgi:hypothetical protein
LSISSGNSIAEPVSLLAKSGKGWATCPPLVVNKTWLCWPVTASSRGFLLPVHIGDLPRTAPRRLHLAENYDRICFVRGQLLRTRQAIADLINSFSGLKTDINQRQQHCGLAHMSERAEAAAHAYHVVPS